MKYLLDTDHWSYLQRGHPAVTGRVSQLSRESQLYMSVITQGEMLSGVVVVVNEIHRERLQRLYERTLEQAAGVLPITEAVAAHYAEILAYLRRSGRPIPTNDIWIAASALVYDMILVSADRHFRFIDGLTVEDWSQQEEP
jgi:predicted nucleic acid-binding protein